MVIITVGLQLILTTIEINTAHVKTHLMCGIIKVILKNNHYIREFVYTFKWLCIQFVEVKSVKGRTSCVITHSADCLQI